MNGDLQIWEDGGDDVTTIDWMRKHNFKEIENPQDIRRGDIIIFGNIDPKTGEEKWVHTFVVTQYDYETGKCSKLDYGSNSRIHSIQPYEDVNFDQWNEGENNIDFKIALRPDYIAMARQRHAMDDFREQYKKNDAELIKEFKKIEENTPNETQKLLENLSIMEKHQEKMHEMFPDYECSLRGFTEAKKAETVQDVISVANILKKESLENIPNGLKFAVDAAVTHKYFENTNSNDNPNDDFKYYTQNFEGLSKSLEELPDDEKNVCCATYVSWVMKQGGYMNDDEGGNEDMHLSDKINEFCQSKTNLFKEATDYSDLRAGDILYYSREDGGPHIEIFAGYEIDENNNKNNVVLNAGSDFWISSELPTSRDDSSGERSKKTPTKVWRMVPYGKG